MSWQNSLVKLAGFQVEELRKRLAGIMDRKDAAEMRLAMLHAEAEAESARAAQDAEAGWYRLGYLDGWRARRDAILAQIQELAVEEAGARDALSEAFTELKKYEQVEENAVLAARKEQSRRETADMDELGLRRAFAR